MNRTLTSLATFFALIANVRAGEIHDAAAKGDVARVKALLAKDGLLVHAKDYAFRQTPLHVAASAGQVEVVKALIAAGADLDVASAGGVRPVSSALLPAEASEKFHTMLLRGGAVEGAASGIAEVARSIAGIARGEDEGTRSRRLAILGILIERGAKIEWEDITLLHEAAVVSDAAGIALLLDKGLKVNVRDQNMRTPLHFAAIVGNAGAVAALLARDANVNALDKQSQAPLHAVAMSGDVPVLELLLRHKAIVDAQRLDGRTALHVAAARKNNGIALRLLEAGADIGVTDKGGWTPLHSACSSGAKEIVEALLTRHAAFDARDLAGFTPFLNAMENGHMEVAELLLAKGADPKARAKDERTALHLLSALPAKPEWIERLIALGLEVQARDDVGFTPLMTASLRGRAEAAETLMRHGANANTTMPKGNTALLFAAAMGRDQPPGPGPAATSAEYQTICELLVKNGARADAKNEDGFTLLIAAARSGNATLVRLALENGGDVNAEIGRLTPLHLAAQDGHAEAAEILLQHGAKVDVPGPEGQTPLHFAAWKSPKAEIFDLLKKHGANLNAHCTAYGRTPLTHASLFGNVIAIKRLLALGADPSEPDGDGYTPLHMSVNICDPTELKAALFGKDATVTKAAVRSLNFKTENAVIARVHAKSLKTDLPARHLEITRLLLEAGASPTAKAKDGRTPLSVAGEVGTPEIVRLLKNPPSPAKKKPLKP